MTPIRAAVVIDPQCGFSSLCPDELPVKGAEILGPKISALLKYCDYKLLSKEAHPQNAVWITDEGDKVGAKLQGFPNANCLWPAHCISGSKGASLLPGLPHVSEFNMVVYKGVEPDLHPFGACYHDLNRKVSTGIIEYLQTHKIQEVLVCGLAYEFCVKETVLQLLDGLKGQDCKVRLCAFATEGLTDQGVEEASKELREAGCEILESADCLDARRNDDAP